MLVVNDDEGNEYREIISKIHDLFGSYVGSLHKVNWESLDADSDVVSNLDTSSTSSGCSCQNCSTTCDCNGCQPNNVNMDFADEPDSDFEFSDDSDRDGGVQWVADMDEVSINVNLGSPQSQDDSYQDEDMEEDDIDLDDLGMYNDFFDDATPQAIEVDSSGSSVEDIYEEVEDDYNDYDEGDQQEEEIEQHEEDDSISLDNYSTDDEEENNYTDFNDTNDCTSFSNSSFSDASSRSRSPVFVRPSNNDTNTRSPEVVRPLPQSPPLTNRESEIIRANGDQICDRGKNGTNVKPATSNHQNSSSGDAGDADDGMCCICLDSLSDHVVVPCGHICLCEVCKDRLITNDNQKKNKKCPICKTTFKIIIKVYK